MALNLLRDCKDIKGEEEKKEGCVKHRERSSEAVSYTHLTLPTKKRRRVDTSGGKERKKKERKKQ